MQVALRLVPLSLALACASPAPALVAPAVTPRSTPAPSAPAPSPAAPIDPAGHGKVHFRDDWIPLRAGRLGIDAELAAKRDAAFGAVPAEDGLWWDEQVAHEVWSVWTDLCMECHDGARSLKKVLNLPPPSRGWTEEDALFFAKSSAPRSVFRLISDGVRAKRPEDKDMPAWKTRLSNEQMWGLVYFVRASSKKRGGDLR